MKPETCVLVLSEKPFNIHYAKDTKIRVETVNDLLVVIKMAQYKMLGLWSKEAYFVCDSSVEELTLETRLFMRRGVAMDYLFLHEHLLPLSPQSNWVVNPIIVRRVLSRTVQSSRRTLLSRMTTI